jgi:hypothetical protein
MLYRGNNHIHVCPTKNRPVFGPAQVLASHRPVVTETVSKNSSAIRRALLPVQIHFPIDHVRHLATLAQGALLKKFAKSDV